MEPEKATKKTKTKKLLKELEHHVNERMGRLEDKLEQRDNLNYFPNHILELKEMQKQSIEGLTTSVRENSARIVNLEEAIKKVTEPIENITPSQHKVWSKKERVNKISERAFRFLSTTSAHGMERIAKTDNFWVKIYWSILVIAFITFGANNISKEIADFYQYDSITNIESVAIKNFTFPTIAICTKRIFTKEYYLNGSLVKVEIVFNYSIKDFIDFTKSHFNNVRLNLSELEFFEIPQRYGDCVRFHGIKANETLTVNSPSELLSFVFRNNASVSSSEFIQNSNSYFVYVKDINFNSYMNTERFRAKKYKAYYMNINRVFLETKLGEPFNNCSESLDKAYHQENCIDQCINRKIKNKYNCSIPSYYFRADDVEICSNQKPNIFNNIYTIPSNYFDDDLFYFYEELINSYGNNLENLTVEFQNECESKCPKECRSSRFSVQSILSAVDKSSTDLNIAISDFSTLEITQIPKMSSFDLVSSIGGTLGLCVGVSFLSFVELFEFLFDLIFILFTGRFYFF